MYGSGNVRRAGYLFCSAPYPRAWNRSRAGGSQRLAVISDGGKAVGVQHGSLHGRSAPFPGNTGVEAGGQL